MDRMKKNFYLLFTLSFLIFSCIYSHDSVVLMFPKEKYEPNDIDITLLLSDENDLTFDEYNYQRLLIRQEHEYLDSKNKMLLNDGSFLIGTWLLCDSDLNPIEKRFYNFSNQNIIGNYNEFLVIDNLNSRSYIYQGIDNQLYIFTRWVNLIRQIKILDNEMYFYILDGDNWILDPIHAEGKYTFIKAEN